VNKRIVLRPIGYVYNGVPGPRYHDWGDVISDVVLDEELTPALDGIEDYSHIMVLFHISGVTPKQRAVQKVRPRNQQDLPEVGVFATHSQFRPNPIGLTVVRLLERQGNRLRVLGLDAYSGSPVIDIKGYEPDYDPSTEARIPEWLQRMRAKRQECGSQDRRNQDGQTRSETT
jgi:tRNA (adenine37-N6)-methyltransferase